MFKLIRCRLLLRYFVGPQVMGRMTPSEMVALGLKDPHVASIKAEPHNKSKAESKRWRTIWVQSVLDALVQMVTHRNGCKREIAKYQDAEHHVGGVGMGHADDGVRRTGDVGLWLAAGNSKIASVDAQGWDLGVDRDSLMYDAARRIDTLSDEGLSVWDYDLYAVYTLCECLANSAHVLAIGEDLFEVCKFGITASGVGSTSSQNSAVRGMHAHNITRRRVHANGDDLLVAGALTPEEKHKFETWGVKHKKVTVSDFTAGEAVPYTSHLYRYSPLIAGPWPDIIDIGEFAGGTILATYDNFEKMCARMLLKYTKGSPPDDVLGGVAFAIRHSPEQENAFKTLCATKGWSLDNAEPYQRQDVYG